MGKITALQSQLVRLSTVLAVLLPLGACGIPGRIFGSGPDAKLGETAALPSVFGYVVADEPQAAVIGRQILNGGGNAADAAVATGLALSVTLPSRAGLGGGGACLVWMPDAQGAAQPPVALLFPPGAPASAGGGRPAAVPMLARGLLAMQARYGSQPFSTVVAPAERLAGGVPVSPALAADLAVVGGALLADPAAAAVFAGRDGGVLQAGENLSQPDLAASFEVLRTRGVQGFYQGAFPAGFTAAADQAGAGLSVADMQSALPRYAPPGLAPAGRYRLASLPAAPPQGGGLPASAGFAALDRNGGAVACAVTMDNLFGTGRIAPGTGILLAASPLAVPAPSLAAAIAETAAGTFRAAVTGTGQAQAAAAASEAMDAALNRRPASVPDPGRANVISCPGGVPGGEASCSGNADPRGLGLVVGGR